MSHRPVLVAYGVFAFTILLGVVALGGAFVVGMTREDAVESYLVTNSAIGLAAAPCGLLIARARPRNPIGWLFLGLGIAPLLSAAMVPLMVYGDQAGWSESALRLIITVFMFSWGWGVFVCLPIALQLFPTGRPVGPWWRLSVWFTLGAGVLGTYGTGDTPELGASSYLVLPGHEVAESLLGVVVLVWPLSIASLAVRFVRADATVRRQLLWLVLAVLVVVGLNLPWAFSLHQGSEILFLLAFPLIPLAVTVAVLRDHLFDVRLVVSRVLLYELLTVALVAGYLGLVAVLERVMRGAGAPVLATAAVAVAFNPARVRLQRWVDRALYGIAGDPARLVSVVGPRLAGEDLEGVLDALREALRVPYAELRVANRVVASSGQLSSEQHVVPLSYRGDALGALTVGTRWGERRLPARDRAVLDLLATPLAVAVRATLLSGELQSSREQLVEAGADERRRLHRELHDSLGPVLTGAALMADSAAMAAARDPERAERLATELSQQLRHAITDVRRIVYGLRPPVLDEVGLVGALRRQEGQLGPLALAVDAPRELPSLPAAVEVAAYRVASEAVTNVARHAGATHAVISLKAEPDFLRLTVTDDGASSDGWTAGVGLRSMQERVVEVGGRFEAGPTPAGGRVDVVLPLRGRT